MEVTFGERWGRHSYLVTYTGAYKNDRLPHVQSDMPDLSGQTFPLGQRRTWRKGAHNTAVMYDVVGVTDNGRPAHITVYFGPSAEAPSY